MRLERFYSVALVVLELVDQACLRFRDPPVCTQLMVLQDFHFWKVERNFYREPGAPDLDTSGPLRTFLELSGPLRTFLELSGHLRTFLELFPASELGLG